MKKIYSILLVAVLAIACAGSASAQFRFGIKAGVNVNKMHLSEVQKTFDADNGAGFTGGLMTEFQIPIINLCFDASVMYTRMNSSFGLESANTEVYPGFEGNNGKIGKDFIEIPINIKYKFGLPVVGFIISPYIFTGPSFAFKLDKNSVDYFKTKTCQTAWNVGLGVELIRHLQVGASYGFGMNNVAKWAGVNNATQVKAKNNYWTITAAYLF